ncbi:hypothetical protein BDR04DRAFT_1099825 [Suillus decipiens]|nr:hypothetical protein BDR04DRAFT_1099825 [Suillus decipiens]
MMWECMIKSSHIRPDPLKMYDGICYQDVEPTPLQKFVRSTKAPAASFLGCRTCLK